VSDDERRPAAADGSRLRRLLRDDDLDVTRLDLLPRLPDGSEVWMLPSTGTDWFGLWQRLRVLVARTGRWPVATCSWGYDEDHLNREPAGATSGTLPPPVRLMREVGELDVGAALDRAEAASFRQPLEDAFDWHQDATRRRCGLTPALSEVREALGEEPSEMALERWFLHWELTEGGLVPTPGEARYLDWFVPGPDQEVSLLMLPAAEPWSVAAWTTSFEGEWPEPALRPAVLRDWGVRFGAEPAANWLTMQQLVVNRPPSGLDEAFAVARTTDLLWPSTLSGPGVTVRELAVDLVGRTRWFLHFRP
jgi:hypothetical protein